MVGLISGGILLLVVGLLIYMWLTSIPDEEEERTEPLSSSEVGVVDKGENDPLYSLPLNCMVVDISETPFSLTRKYKYINPKTGNAEVFKLKEVVYTYYYWSGPYFEFTIEHIGSNTDVTVMDSLDYNNLYKNHIGYLLGANDVCPYFGGATHSRSDTEKNIADFLKVLNKLTPTYIEKLKKEQQEKLKQEKWDNLAKTSEANKKTFKDVKAQLEPYKRKTTYKPIELVGYRSKT